MNVCDCDVMRCHKVTTIKMIVLSGRRFLSERGAIFNFQDVLHAWEPNEALRKREMHKEKRDTSPLKRAK